MKFDVVVGNPPYERDMYKEFMIRALDACVGPVVMITPGTFLTGNRGLAFRCALATHNTHNVQWIDVLPTGTFKSLDKNDQVKNMLLPVAITCMSPQPCDNIVMTRVLSGQRFTWHDTMEDGAEMVMYYDDVGKGIWHKCSQYDRLFDMSSNRRHVNQQLVGGNISFGSKNENAYFGYSLPLSKLTGQKIQTGVRADPHGKYEWLPNMSRTGVRYVYKTDHADNVKMWMSSKLFGVLLTMASLQSSNSSSTIGKLPFIELTGVYADQAAFDQAAYDELQLTADERVWIDDLGVVK